MKKHYLIVVLFIIFSFSCTKAEEPEIEEFTYHKFNSFADFENTLTGILSLEDIALKEENLSVFWDSLKLNKQIPFVYNDSVMFLYKGSAGSVSWAGDFSGWKPNKGTKLEGGNVWVLEKSFPSDARLDYKIVLGNNWILDPDNTCVQYSGFGPNSELRMPEWEYPEETILGDGVNRGDLSDNMLILATTLGCNLQYKVYTPFGYEQFNNLPVIYVADGHEYADARLGSMLIVLDNLIHLGEIKPIIAVFIDPRNPANLSENRRGDQYTGNMKFVNFMADELVPTIDSNYKTKSNADARAVLGTSYGGWNSGFVGVNRSDVFHLIGIHSPAFDSRVIAQYESSELLPLKIFMSTGVIYDTQDKARAMKKVLDAKGYSLQYIEVNEGHSWGTWRALIKEPLVYFFSK